MTEKTFVINGTRMKVVDVGGQRNERKKWIHSFEHVNAVIFVISLTCYDEVPFEEVTDLDVDVNEKNNMIESIEVFEHTLRYECFKNTCFILFFNKYDLFEEKIKHSPITRAFPEFEQDTTDVQQCVDYIRQQFLEKAQSNSSRALFTHITCATDKENVKKVFNDVQIGLVSDNLDKADLV
ncbi:G-protein alpha subunit [Reticulomyxa filosa]|uniref:G-protein alpha subunit n=1 Tax=Reticulomyxa filosa TaxID=46433 RepID=X6LTE8_RETFI|nr:G-protein alpha subunit [Reticulomyxa filosa]|eukprot:ETO04010.1 G-protein alpha subunit [Reticulomyxa filosa]